MKLSLILYIFRTAAHNKLLKFIEFNRVSSAATEEATTKSLTDSATFG